MSKEIPDWLYKYVQQARDLFGVGGAEWHIYVKLSDKPGGNTKAAGSARTDFQYLNADIEFVDSIAEDNRGREIVLHEIGHVAHQEVDNAVDFILAQVEEDRRAVFSQMYNETVERFLQRVSRSLVFHIRMDDLGKDGSNDHDG